MVSYQEEWELLAHYCLALTLPNLIWPNQYLTHNWTEGATDAAGQLYDFRTLNIVLIFQTLNAFQSTQTLERFYARNFQISSFLV